ncbi:thiamine phosphate synthase [Nafulsella turpanensis]|uniref:thiamine phosphate synthase n=1 Tax=Nafulsella turpanensis TaxID=1265690 RepID=UPI0003489F77|nr:thiamine phosphate synthase [Nafulsella turpanensis]
MQRGKKITGGIYLVLNPALEKPVLLEKLEQALEGGIAVLQIWNNWVDTFSLTEKRELIGPIIKLASAYQVPVLINEEWELLKGTSLDGVHFDAIPENYERIKQEIGRRFMAGITCSNNLAPIYWAEENRVDYVSFCSVFPSSSVASCEIVKPETIRKAREITQMPLFLSGGISVDNMSHLQELDFNGVAVISGILNAESSRQAAASYQDALNKLN